MSQTLVSRGGRKLAAALERFGLAGAVRGAQAIDVGASTGGFTEVLLDAGAAAVTAVDVGHGQLHPRLRGDARVTVLEKTDFKTLSLHVAPGPFDFFVVDVSFVAARNMLRGLAFRLRPGARGVVLVKPQFELPARAAAGDLGDPALRARALDSFRRKAERLGFRLREHVDSPVPGGEGTVEILTHLELVERAAVLPARREAGAPRAAQTSGRQASGDRQLATGVLRWFAVAAPGLEDVVRDEAARLAGVKGVKVVPGGVEFSGELAVGMVANLELRVASRVVVRVGEVKAREFAKLRHLAAKLPWQRFVATGRALRLSVSASHCRLYHTGAVGEAVAFAIGDRLGVKLPLAAPRAADGEDEVEADETRVLARGQDDHWTFSVDSSGALLHRRGWRTEAGAAPLRETLAAGLLALAAYDPAAPLCDPMCGAGTIALEAAALARGRAPGLGRVFAFEGWPVLAGVEGAAALRAEATAREAPAGGPIFAWDRDAKAIERARRNAERAGLGEAVSFAVARLGPGGTLEPPALLDELAARTAGAPGLVLVNPPYGRRLGSPAQASRLVRMLGELLRARFAGWRAGVMLADRRWERALGLEISGRHALSSGGLRLTFVVGRVAGAQARPRRTG